MSLIQVRAGYGLLQLASAPLVFHGADRQSARRTVQVLGLRQLVQAAVTAPTPSPAVLALGTEADLLHAFSMVALAAASRRNRCAASALACAGMIAEGRRGRDAAGTQSPSRLVGMRDRYARTAARYVVPVRLPVMGPGERRLRGASARG